MIQEEMVRAALDGAMRDEPPCVAGLDEVLARARRIQVRRRVGAGVAGASVTGLALTVALAAAQRGGSSDDLAAPPPASRAPTTAAPPAGGTRVTAPGPMLETLKRLVPPGFRVSKPFAAEGYAVVVLTDAAGKGQVLVNVQPTFGGVSRNPRVAASARAAGKALDVPSYFKCAGRTDLPAAGSTCDDEQLPDGTWIVTSQGPSEPAGVGGGLMAMVDVLTPDGVRIAVSEYNRDGSGGTTRPTPPLTTDQLRAIATDPAWLG